MTPSSCCEEHKSKLIWPYYWLEAIRLDWSTGPYLEKLVQGGETYVDLCPPGQVCFSELGWCPLAQRRKYDRIRMCRRILKGSSIIPSNVYALLFVCLFVLLLYFFCFLFVFFFLGHGSLSLDLS